MKIFCFIGAALPFGDVGVMAICEDGLILASHTSSNEKFAKHDIGITSQRKHDLYAAHCSNGYELEWVESPSTHEGLKKASALSSQVAVPEA